MSVKNPTIDPTGSTSYRRPDFGDTRAVGRGIAQLGEVVKKIDTEYQKGKVASELEAERQQFLEESYQSDEARVDNALFDEDPNKPMDEQLASFQEKLSRLSAAKSSGSIGATELRIRQEKILREHMASRPDLAEEFVRVSQLTQGYNPIGSEVDALEAAQQNAGKYEREMLEQARARFIQLGVNPALALTHPQEFYRQGLEMANAAQKTQVLLNQYTFEETGNKLEDIELQRAFHKTVADGALAALPSAVNDFVTRWETAVGTGAWANDPQVRLQLEGERQALITRYMYNGPAYKEFKEKVYQNNPNMTTRGYEEMWQTRIEPFFKVMSEARSPEEARKATAFLMEQPTRTMILDNPEIELTMSLIKGLGPALATTEMEVLRRDLSTKLTQLVGPIFASGRNGVITNPDGSTMLHPGITTPAAGSDHVAKGNPERGLIDWDYTVGSAKEFLKQVPLGENGPDATSADRGVGLYSQAAVSSQFRRKAGWYPPPESRRAFLEPLAADSFLETAYAAQEPLRQNLAEEGIKEVEGMRQDIAREAKKHFSSDWGSADWEAAPGVYVDLEGGSMVFKAQDAVSGDRETIRLVNQLTTRFLPQINLAWKAYYNLQQLQVGRDVKLNPEAVAGGFALKLEAELFNRGH